MNILHTCRFGKHYHVYKFALWDDVSASPTRARFLRASANKYKLGIVGQNLFDFDCYGFTPKFNSSTVNGSGQ